MVFRKLNLSKGFSHFLYQRALCRSPSCVSPSIRIPADRNLSPSPPSVKAASLFPVRNTGNIFCLCKRTARGGYLGMPLVFSGPCTRWCIRDLYWDDLWRIFYLLLLTLRKKKISSDFAKYVYLHFTHYV